MAVSLVLAPEVEEDLSGAFAWYEGQRSGLGEELLRCIEAGVEAIRRRPLAHPVTYENYRRALVRRFPYAIFFEYAHETVTVYAIFHTARDPKKWRRRLP